MTNIGFIGLGLMGAPMAGHLLDAAFTLNVHNRTRAKALEKHIDDSKKEAKDASAA